MNIGGRIGRLAGTRAGIVAACLLVVAVVVGGVFVLRDGESGASPGPAPTPVSPTVTESGAVSMAGRAPLTGVLTKDALKRPAVTVKISNTPDAHQHRGLAEADLVFVEPIAGATTRLAAIFHSKLPAQVGPVRSLRPMDAALIGPTKGIIASTMADRWVLDYLDKTADLANLGSLRVPQGTYAIDNGRRAPNHVFARPAKLLALTDRAKPSMTILDVFDASGPLKVFTGGKTVSGRWTKAGANEPFTFTAADGGPLLLTPGTTWIECALTDMPVAVK